MAKQLKEFLESFEFNRAALAKQRLQNLRHSGRRVRGARIANLMRAAGLKEEEMDEEDLDQLDEVLNKDAKASDWIHDFVHSTNPKFEGKSKKERIKMALGAYYGKQNEEVVNEEQIDEKSDQARRNKTWKNVMAASRGAKANKDVGLTPDITGHKNNQQMNKAIGRAVARGEFHEGTETKDKKKEDLPFDPDPPKKNPAAKAGKYGQGYSTARHLARQGMKQAMKEEFDMDVSDDELDQIVEGVLGALAGGALGAAAAGPVGVLSGAYLGHKVQQGAKKNKQQKEEVEHTGPVKVKVQADKEAHEEKWEFAKKKPVKEQYDEEGNLIPMAKTYQEFMEGITVKTATGYRHIGTYGTAKGAKYGNTDYDKETLDTKDDEGEETPKRGRGRPAGSKSGARGPRIK